ncbi:MAG: hypothetical protein ABIA74_00340 [bacterium]
MKLHFSYRFFVTLLFFYFFSLTSKNSYQAVQQLHQKISNDLISLRKEYPTAQSTIYPILDEVGQMYKISRNMIQKKKDMKQKFLDQNKVLETISLENNELKQSVNDTQKLSLDKQKEFEELNNKLKTSQVQLAFLVREREELGKRINQLENQQLQQLEKIDINKNNIEEQMEHDSQMPEDQNLNLTSISEPSSPR